MRLAPVPIMFVDAPEKAALLSAEQALTTHGAIECIDASRLFGGILARVLSGASCKEKVLVPGPADSGPDASARLQGIAAGKYFGYGQEQIRGSGYVVDSLEAALWCFYTTGNFHDAVLAAANLGDDADTTAAITGKVAGAFYGEAGIPAEWLATVAMAKEIGEMAEQLLQREKKGED